MRIDINLSLNDELDKMAVTDCENYMSSAIISKRITPITTRLTINITDEYLPSNLMFDFVKLQKYHWIHLTRFVYMCKL
jgi:hypothetical protein